MSDLECPYCNAELEVCHDDGFGYDEGKAHEMECYECEKVFTFQTCISYDYEPSKADCLNGAPHVLTDWRKLWTHEGFAAYHRSCKTCDENQQLTGVPIGEDPNELL